MVNLDQTELGKNGSRGWAAIDFRGWILERNHFAMELWARSVNFYDDRPQEYREQTMPQKLVKVAGIAIIWRRAIRRGLSREALPIRMPH
ncbi:MAG: hypothetical protein H6Q04_938 [Acidobacteria bacterium]|nr:hypothetical protein [Acidobacteriota bacterium]